jgi:hypothetical protein
MKTLDTPIEGAEKPLREIAVLFARAAAPEVAKITAIRVLEQKIAEAERKSRDATEASQTASRAAEAANADAARAAAEEAPGEPSKSGLFGAIALGLVLTIAGFVIPKLPGVARVLPLMIGAVLVFVMLRKHRAAVAAANAERARIAAEQSRTSGVASRAAETAKGARSASEAATAELARLKSEHAKAPRPRAMEGIGRAYLPLRTIDLVGQTVAVDESGCFETVACKLPDFSADEARLGRVEAAIAAARATPVLLAPTQVRGESVGALFGEEAMLAGAVEDMVSLLKGIPVIDERLRLIPNNAQVARLLAGAKSSAHAPLPGVRIVSRAAESDQRSLGRMVALATKLRGAGGAVSKRIEGLFDELDKLLDVYRDKRTLALSQIHDRLIWAMSRTAWSHTTFYCPKTNLVPEYLSHRLGFTIEEAHLTNQAELLKALHADEEIGHRMASDPNIARKLTDAYNGIDEVTYELKKQEAIVEAPEDKNDAAQFTVKARAVNICRALRQQLDQYVLQYRAALSHALTGRTSQVYELSPQSRLYYDPKTDTWSSPVAKTTYRDLKEVGMGAVLAMRDQLLIPMWNHLWTEKADFRRSEMFRTNEQLLRMSEKESEKLLQVSAQFKDDMRMVRENILDASAELESKVHQINDTMAGLQTMGLLSPQQLTDIERRVKSSFSGEILGIKRHAESKEFLLALEPQAQAERRGTSADPIQTVSGPALFFKPTETSLDMKPKLAADKNEAKALPNAVEAVASPAPLRRPAVAARKG